MPSLIAAATLQTHLPNHAPWWFWAFWLSVGAAALVVDVWGIKELIRVWRTYR